MFERWFNERMERDLRRARRRESLGALGELLLFAVGVWAAGWALMLGFLWLVGPK